MEDSEVPHLDIEVTEAELKEGIAKIAKVLRPNWKPDQIQTKDRSSGYINRNFHCYVPDNEDPFFLRIINTAMPGQVERAQNAMRYLRQRKLGAQLLLTFKNGLVMEFIEGEVVTWETIDRVKEPEVWLSYAREMAKFHATTNEEDAKKFNIPTHEASMQVLNGMMRGVLASGKITPDMLEGLPTFDQIEEWRRMIYKQLLEAGAETKFCHMDANPTNLLIRKDNSVVIVDYDDCFMDLTCLEMAGAFAGLCGIRDFSIDRLPTEEEKEKFLREYLKSRHEMEGKNEVPEKTVEFWKFLLRKSFLHGLLMGIVVGLLLQTDITKKAIDVRLCREFWDIYQKDADQVLAETFTWD